jgi:HD domain
LHALALLETGDDRIDDIPPSGVPESPLMKRGSQADHYRGVATMALGMAKGLEDVMGDVAIDRDLLVAAALVHDVGKAYEFSNWSAGRTTGAGPEAPPSAIRSTGRTWRSRQACPRRSCTVWPRTRTWAKARSCGRSIETTIVQYADVAFWKILDAGSLLEAEMDISGVLRR